MERRRCKGSAGRTLTLTSASSVSEDTILISSCTCTCCAGSALQRADADAGTRGYIMHMHVRLLHGYGWMCPDSKQGCAADGRACTAASQGDSLYS